MLYKYCRFNDYAMEIVQRNRLFCNHFELFNDPFECWCTVQSGFPDPHQDEARFLEVIGAWGFTEAHRDDALENYPLLIESLEGSELSVPHAIDSARICCFCMEQDNLLMWSHYADGLRGFCIGFDRDKLAQSLGDRGGIYEVEYRSEPPEVDTCVWAVADDQVDYHAMVLHEHPTDPISSDYRDWMGVSRARLETLYKRMLATKPKQWEYEREARLIFHTGASDVANNFSDFDLSCIRSVTVGMKMSEVDRSILLRAFTNQGVDVPLYIASRSPGSYLLQLEAAGRTR